MILTLAGKVDTRCIIYPLARALSLKGLVAVVTDDGAYRRLYKGNESTGNISGIDIYSDIEITEELIQKVKESGVNYDTIIVASRSYIPSETDSVLICHGVDDSMTQKIEEETDEEKQERIKREEKKQAKLNKKKGIQVESQISLSKSNQEQENNSIADKDDTFDIPSGVKQLDIFISYMKPIDKYKKGILLRDGYIQYIYSCEERKSLDRIPDKGLNKLIANIVAELLNTTPKELLQLLTTLEYTNESKKGLFRKRG